MQLTMRPSKRFRSAQYATAVAALLIAASSGFASSPASAQEPQVTPPQASPAPVAPTQASPIPATSAPALVSPAVPGTNGSPIALVPVEDVEVTGTLDVSQGKVVIGKSGIITAGKHTATVTLPQRGELYLCATTKVNLTTDSSVPTTNASDAPGLMMALDKGALEAKFATGKNSDVVLTPDFRILISGPGVADVQVRLGQKGDTCVDNSGPDAPYVAVSSVFDGGVYRVQAGQRVMFQHGSLTEVIDNERESCGCPPEPPTIPTGNEFPVAQSAGLAPILPATTSQHGEGSVATAPQLQVTLTHNAGDVKPSSDTTPEAETPSAKPAAVVPPATLADAAADAAKPAPKPEKKGGWHKVGRFFKRIFGG
jgi:hypothetical protein